MREEGWERGKEEQTRKKSGGALQPYLQNLSIVCILHHNFLLYFKFDPKEADL